MWPIAFLLIRPQDSRTPPFWQLYWQMLYCSLLDPLLLMSWPQVKPWRASERPEAQRGGRKPLIRFHPLQNSECYNYKP